MDNNKRKLAILSGNDSTHQAPEELPAPFSLADLQYLRLKRGYPETPNLKHSYIKDGVAIKGLDLQQTENLELLKSILNNGLVAINSVQDEHFKALGLISAGFLRFLELGFASKKCTHQCEKECNKKFHVELNLYFRFTTNSCPAGIRMMLQAKQKLVDILVTELKCEPRNISINCIHGGSPWELNDIYDQTQREIMQALLRTLHHSSASI